jgi:hypothetical protein
MAPPMECTVDGRTIRGRESVLCVVSTLDRLILGTRPHWGAEAAPLHFTLVERHSRRFWRNLPRLARGEPGNRLTPDNGYHSHNAAAVDLSFAGPYVIDGELSTHSGEEGPLRISAVTGVRWVVP